MFLPFVQSVYPFKEVKSLNGWYEKYNLPEFEINNWISGNFQHDFDKYIQQNFGFRSWLVKLYNEFYFQLFRETKAKNVIIGKEDVLYEKQYLDALYGLDFIGQDSIKLRVDAIERISDVLKNNGVQLVVVLAPGKASFYPEFVPDSYSVLNKKVTNYETYKKELIKSKVNFIDFNQWFRKMKDTSSFRLYPKTGVHWSKYAELIVTDTLIKYLEKTTSKQFPRLLINEIEKSKGMRDSDDDIEKSMNLFYDIPDFEMTYASYKIQKDSTIEYPKVLVVSDSYYWGIFNYGFSRDLFSNGQFWFYNNQIYPDSYDEPLFVQDINYREELNSNDVVILLSTDANLYKFPFGFIEDFNNKY